MVERDTQQFDCAVKWCCLCTTKAQVDYIKEKKNVCWHGENGKKIPQSTWPPDSRETRVQTSQTGSSPDELPHPPRIQRGLTLLEQSGHFGSSALAL
jgi:hypothetical protein